MITVLIDPESKYIVDKNYIRIDYTELPKSYSTSTDIHRIIMSKDIVGKDKFVVIEGVDRLDEKKSALLCRILIAKPDSTYILLTAKSEENVSKHILNLAPSIKRVRGKAPPRIDNIWQNLKLNMISRRMPKDDEMPLLIRSIGDTRTIHEDNRELAAELDTMLFKTHTRYLAGAWAGLHRKENRRLTVKSFKKKETKSKLKRKIHPTMVKRAKKDKTKQKSLEDWL